MAAKKAATPTSNEIVVSEIHQGRIDMCIIGKTPLIYNAMSNKAKQTLLLPAPRKNAAQKSANLKHSPLQEYRDSVYLDSRADAPTRLVFPATAFKRAIAEVCIDLDTGAKKAQVQRLVSISGDRIALYGTPQLLMSVVRCADMSRTPDIRTRAILPRWCCVVSVDFIRPNLSDHAVANLLAAAGQIIGVGDFRQQKGAGNYGLFQLASHDSPEFKAITQEAAAAQDAALESPEFYDDETRELFTWYNEEVATRYGKDKVTR